MINKTLYKRIITAIIGAPLILYATLYSETATFAVMLGVIILLGAWEWADLSGFEAKIARYIFMAANAACLLFGWFFFLHQNITLPLLLIGLAWWAMAFIKVLNYSKNESKPRPYDAVIKMLSGVLVFTIAWIAMVSLHAANSTHLLAFLFILIWVADTGAYFVGRRWGRTALAPQISPGKTREGLFGALVLVSVYAIACGHFFGYQDSRLVFFSLLSIIVALISVLGDLTESLLKRERGVKDSGSLLPGHGGILDRIDSLLAATPVFVCGLIILDIQR